MGKQQNLNAKTLAPFVPEGASELVVKLLNSKDLNLTIKNPRKTKVGDYRPPTQKGQPHKISVNGDLNPYAFLVTLIHEFAHLTTFEQYDFRKIKPHGSEWKNEFKQLLNPFLEENIFPQSIKDALDQYLKNPAAATCTDYQLMKALRAFDKDQDKSILLEELPDNTHFLWNKNRVFKKEKKIRKRYRCLDLQTQRYYLFNPAAEVKPYSTD